MSAITFSELYVKKDIAANFLRNENIRNAKDIYLSIIEDIKGLEDSSKYEARKLHIACLNNLSVIFLRLEEFQETVSCTTEALCFDNKNVKALFRRAQAYKALGIIEKAIRDVNTLLNIEPTNCQAIDFLQELGNQRTIRIEKDVDMNHKGTEIYSLQISNSLIESQIASTDVVVTDVPTAVTQSGDEKPIQKVYEEHFMNPNWMTSSLTFNGNASKDFLDDMTQIIQSKSVSLMPSKHSQAFISEENVDAGISDKKSKSVCSIEINEHVSAALDDLAALEIATKEYFKSKLSSTDSITKTKKPHKKKRQDQNINEDGHNSVSSLNNRHPTASPTVSHVWRELLSEEQHMKDIVSNRLLQKQQKAASSTAKKVHK